MPIVSPRNLARSSNSTMSSVIAFRNTNPSTPFRFLYGVRNGLFLFPLDLVFTRFNDDLPDRTQGFVGAQIAGTGFTIGKIHNYHSWPDIGSINPVVEVTPDANFPTTPFPVLPSLPLPIQPNNTIVETQIHDSTIRGVIKFFDPQAAYIDIQHHVQGYYIQFDVPLLHDHHGAAVYIAGHPNQVIGMVTRAQRIFNAPNTLVCPV